MTKNKYFDPVHNRLVFLGERPTIRYWEKKWQKSTAQDFLSRRGKNLVTSLTRRFLSPGSTILEAGCGSGGYVYDLQKAGYVVKGVDNARKTITRMKNKYPELDLEFGDVTKLKLRQDSVDGYWSIGVIEHFFHGFDEIIKNARTVLRVNGYA